MRISDWSSDVCSSDLGLSVTAGADVTQEGGGDIYRASVLGGFGDLDSDRWNVWGALSVKENRILRGVDRDFANSFQPDRGLSPDRSEEHTSELQSLMRISYAVFCLKKHKQQQQSHHTHTTV